MKWVRIEFDKLAGAEGQITEDQAKDLAIRSGIAKSGHNVEYLIGVFKDGKGVSLCSMNRILVDLVKARSKKATLEKQFIELKHIKKIVDGPESLIRMKAVFPNLDEPFLKAFIARKSCMVWKRFSLKEYTQLMYPEDWNVDRGFHVEQ
jgi:hypothetical protein